VNSGRNVLWDNALPNAAHAMATVANNAWRIVPYEGERIRPVASTMVPIVDEGSADHLVPLRIVLSHESDEPLDYVLNFDTSAEFAAKLGEDFDIEGPISGRIAAGDTHVEVLLRIHGDSVPEANEAIAAPWLTMEGRAIEWPPSAGLLRNDDANTVWIDGAGTVEGNTGTHLAAVQVYLSRPQSVPVALDLFTTSGPGIFRATPDVDFVSIPAISVSIPPGATRATFNVTIIGDTRREPLGERFDIAVRSVTGAVLVGDSGSVLIRDDDSLFVR
jgi:hypothetical protein